MENENIPVATTPEPTPTAPEPTPTPAPVQEEAVPVQVTPEEHIVSDTAVEEQVLEKKKRKFLFIYGILIFILVALAISTAVFFAYKKYTQKRPTTPEKEAETPAVVVPEKPVENPFLKYDSPEFKFSFDYPKVAKSFESPMMVYFHETDLADVKEQNITNGYIFKVNVLDMSNRNIDDISKVKKTSFNTTCPQGARTTDILKFTVDNVEGKSFEVLNCDRDYRITYVQKFGKFYEITQVYNGLFGKKQQYRGITEEMLMSFKFHPEEKPAEDPLISYDNLNYKIFFKYPRGLTVNCCEITAPAGKDIEKLIVFGKEDTNVIGVYIYKNISKLDLAKYVENNRSLLIEDYKVVNGVEPTGLTEEVNVGNEKGVVLSGYSWRGNDFIYFKHPSMNYIYIMVIKTKPSDFFKPVLTDILTSFKFN